LLLILLIFEAKPFMHDRAGRCVLNVNLLVRFDALFYRESRQCGLVKPAQNQLLLAHIMADVANRVNTRLRSLELFRIDIDRLAIDVEGSVRFKRHRPEQTLLYRLIEQYYPDFEMQWASEGRVLPDYVRREFEEYLRCGRLEHGFLRVQCESCHAEHLVAFSCKRRGFCPSCGARRMVESAALLVDEVLPQQPMRQWVLSVPFPLRFLFASQPKIMGKALGIIYRTIATHLTHKAGHKKSTAHTGAVTLIQRFGSALNLNIHFHMLFLDGVYVGEAGPSTRFRWVKAPTSAELTQLTHTIAQRLARYLERQGLLVRDAEHGYLALESSDEDPMDQLQGHSMMCMDARMPRAQDAQERPLTALRWVPNKAVKSSLCKRCRMNGMPMTPRRSETWPASPCMPVWRSKPTSVTSWNACAATSPDRPSLKCAYR
jgi:ribosomal protein S27E